MFEVKKTKELWGVVDESGEVLYTRGGSSTPQKLMVYGSAAKAKAAIRYAPKSARATHKKLYPNPEAKDVEGIIKEMFWEDAQGVVRFCSDKCGIANINKLIEKFLERFYK